MRKKPISAALNPEPKELLDLRSKLNFLSNKIGVKVNHSNHAFEFPHIITQDEDTPGYSSHFILIMKSQEEMWGFHVIHLTVDGKFGSATAALRIHLGKISKAEYGPKFLKTFERTLVRTTRTEAVLGKTDELKKDARWGQWRGRETINDVLYSVYAQMWDMDVAVSEFTTIPKDIVDEYRVIFQMEFGD